MDLLHKVVTTSSALACPLVLNSGSQLYKGALQSRLHIISKVPSTRCSISLVCIERRRSWNTIVIRTNFAELVR